MTRPWGKLHACTLSRPKFLRSTLEERGAWVSLLLYAFNSPNDQDLGTRDDVLTILRREGAVNPEALLDRLVAIGWLDSHRERLFLHDWSDWQPADPTGAARKRGLRALVSGQSADRHETVPGQSRDPGRQDKRRRDDSSHLPPSTRGTERRGRSASLDDLIEGPEA